MIERAKHALGIKTDVEILKEISGEPTVRKAQKALRRGQKWTGIGDDILEDYQEAEDDRRGIKH